MSELKKVGTVFYEILNRDLVCSDGKSKNIFCAHGLDLQVGPAEQKFYKPLRQKCKKEIKHESLSERFAISKTLK